MPNRPTLILAPRGRDAKVISFALKEAGLESSEQRSLAELVANLSCGSAAVVAEEALLHENRAELARWLAEQPPWSDFPFVLLTLRMPGNGQMLAGLTELLGNVTVLERPLAAASLRSAVRAAVRARARQLESAQYLQRLQDLTATLEQRVDERTRQLSETNARLHAEIAERERTEAALRQAQKMEAVGQLTGGIAHDFNNLLMAVTGNLDLLKGRLSDERLARYLSNAIYAAQRGSNLVNQLLAFSRKQQLKPQAVNVNDLIGNIEELISQTLGAGIRVENRRQSDLWSAIVDPTQLELMILNLAINARDAMAAGGTLTIETFNLHEPPSSAPELAPGAYVCVAVRDTGIGMSPEVLARAFDPFFTTKPPGRGTGLGLSQVYGFARQSGGAVRIESEPGVGTVVRIFLPRSDLPTCGDLSAEKLPNDSLHIQAQAE
ncbi:MAG: hybrid sensor histidine kinase/response regulator [Rhizobiales bacterium]|nr:hybrid sensor histidine kinase/response regulator [Hyphomicrobiales bacterium]